MHRWSVFSPLWPVLVLSEVTAQVVVVVGGGLRGGARAALFNGALRSQRRLAT